MKNRRLWSEEELLLVYWFLPIMRNLSRITGREFSAIAMKMANLLAVETGFKEGLTNVSTLDKEIVYKFNNNRQALESIVSKILSTGFDVQEREKRIIEKVVGILKTNKIPLHIEVIKNILQAQDPLFIASIQSIRGAISKNQFVHEIDTNIYEYRQSYE